MIRPFGRRGPSPPGPRPRLPAGIWALGLVSLLMDVSSEMIHALLPLFIVGVLGAPVVALGVLEGLAEATASVTKVFSGAASDWLGRHKALALLGYGLAAATKPVFPLAPSLGWVVAARLLDRLGKGIRGAPRDALVAEIAPPGMRGAAFGLRQSLDTAGAVLGPLLAVALLWATSDRIRTVFWAAVLPALLAVLVLLLAVREPPRPEGRRQVRRPLARAELARLPAAYRAVVGLAALMTLARPGEAFLVLMAPRAGLPLALAPLVLVGMSLAYGLSAYPAGALSDRGGRRGLLGAGMGALVLALLALALVPGLWGLGAGVALWGLHMGLTQGLLAAMVAEAAPPELRGTAFGVLNLAVGVAQVASGLLAGLLWDLAGPAATFLAAAGFAALAAAGTMGIARPSP